jgi:hypothetical protein
MTNDFSWTSRSSNNQGFSGQYNDPAWSGFMNNLNIGGTEPGVFNTNRTYSWTITFNNYGRQRFNTAVDDSGDVRINGVYQFSMGGFSGQTSRTTPGYFAPGTYTISANSVNSGAGPWGIALDWTGFVPPPPPTIQNFYASPNPQNSSNGTPSYSTTLNWASTGQGITSVTLTSSAGESWNESANDSRTITNLPQSNANGTSPATRTYYLQVCNNGGCTNASPVTVSARNDNTLSNSWTTSFTNLDPSTQYDLILGTLAGVDMPTTISASGSGNFVGVSTSFSGTKNFTNGQTVKLRTTTLPFNTDVSGQTGIYGKVNNKTVTITTPSGSFNVTVGTRAPVIKEVFDYDDNINKYPYEDIDLIINTPVEYATTGQVSVNDIEIPQEIKVDQPDAQVRINGGSWQNVREI